MATTSASTGHVRGHRRTISTDIVEKARLEVIVPEAADLDVKEFLDTQRIHKINHLAVTEGSGNNHAIPALSSFAQRQTLFYDEDVTVYIALQIIGIQDDAVYESYSSRLAVSLEVMAVESHATRKVDTSSGTRPGEGPILLYQKTIQDKDSGRISWRDGDVRIAIWKLNVPLGHPKAKTNNPRVVFSASATLRFLNQNIVLPDNEYISSRQALGVNILETFTVDPSQKQPYLSTLRVSRVVPTQQPPKETFSPLGYSSKKTFPIVPALNFKLRGSKTPALSKSQGLFAHLTLEGTPHLGCDFQITDVIILHNNVSISPIEASSEAFPVTLQVLDEVSFVFPISNPPVTTHSFSNLIKSIVLKLRGKALISKSCKPSINTHWETSIDFSQYTPSHTSSSLTTGAALRPPNRPVSSGSSHDPISILADPTGLTITFTGTALQVHPGEIISWRVFVINRSNRARRLALLVPPKRRRGEGKVLPSIPHSMTEAVIDDAILYSNYKSQHLESVELVPLVNDVRIGPLAPNACHTAELRFIALAKGVLTVEGVRVVDLTTNEVTECRDLPTVICN